MGYNPGKLLNLSSFPTPRFVPVPLFACFSPVQPEMSNNLQKYDKQVYLRVSEAQRCRVHTTLVMPIFTSESRDSPVAVFELVQGEREVEFPSLTSVLRSSLKVGDPGSEAGTPFVANHALMQASEGAKHRDAIRQLTKAT